MEKTFTDGAGGDTGPSKKNYPQVSLSTFFKPLPPHSRGNKVMDGAGDGSGDTGYHKYQGQGQGQQYLARNAVYPGGNGGGGGGGGWRDPVENDGAVELPLRILIPNEFIGAIIGRGGEIRTYQRMNE